jgi:hypothetical protein
LLWHGLWNKKLQIRKTSAGSAVSWHAPKRLGKNGSVAGTPVPKTKLQEAIRQATLDDINKELERLEQETDNALKNKEDPPPRTALETKLKKLMPGSTPGVTLLRIADEKGELKYITDRKEIDTARSEYWSKIFT